MPSRCRRTAGPACCASALPYDESDPRVDAAVDALRTDLAPPALDGLHAEYAVGGDAAESLDFVERQQHRLPLVIGFVLLLTLLMMGVDVPQRADRAGLRRCSTWPSVGVAFGLLTLVFQHGLAEGAAGLQLARAS